MASSSPSVMVLTVSVLKPSRSAVSWSSARGAGVGVERADESWRAGSAEDWRVELSEQVSSSDSSWYMGTLARTLVKKAIFSLEE